MTVSEKQEKRRREIAAAVREFFKDTDFEKVSVDDICNATGIAKGTFYHYFSGKDSLLDQIMYPIDDFFDNLKDDLLKCKCFLDAVRQFSECYSTFINASGLNMCRTVTLAMLSPNNRNFISKERSVVNTLYGMIEFWQKQGEVTDEFTAQEICDMFMVVLRGYLLNWYSLKGSYDLSSVLGTHMRIFASGFIRKAQ